jgi:hypothetical protein
MYILISLKAHLGFHTAMRLAVELQPYGSKNLDGYRRAVVPSMQKTWDSADQIVSLTSTECIMDSTHFPAWSMIID